MHRPFAVPATVIVLGLFATPCRAFAQGGDFTIFVGSAYPIDRERFTLRPSTPSIPGADVTVTGDPALRATGGLVLGGALAFELGVFGIEGRVDSTNIGFDLTGARYNLSSGGVTGAIVVRDAHLDADRFNILSVNARLRTPGPVGLVASGGFSYLPSVSIEGRVPIGLEVSGIPGLDLNPVVRLDVVQGESKSRYGFNGGVGLRVGGSRLAVMGEVRAFYFQDYELTFDVGDAPGIVQDLLERIPVVEFDPIILNAQVGLVVRF